MNVDPFVLVANTLGFIGAALMLASYLMKGMMPLRIAALCACVFLVGYGALKHALPTLLLCGALVPINVKKTLAMRRMVQAIERARGHARLAMAAAAHAPAHPQGGRRPVAQG